MNGKSRPKKTLRQRCFELSLLAAVGTAGIAAIAYHHRIRLLTGLRRLRLAAIKSDGSLARSAEDLLKETRLTTAVAKAGWPVANGCIGGTEDDTPFMIVALPAGERAKLCAHDDGEGFILSTLIDAEGKHYAHHELPPELQATSLPYKKFIAIMQRRQDTIPDSAPV